MTGSLQQRTWLDDYEDERRQSENDSDQALLVQQDIEMGATPPPPPSPVIADPGKDSTQALLDVQGTPSEAYMVEEQKGLGSSILDGVAFVASPFAAFGDAALAPVGREKGLDEGFLEAMSKNFQVSGKAFVNALFPEYGKARPEYGKAATEQLGINEKWALPLEILSDPTMTMGLGSAKLLQKSIRGQQLVAPEKQMGLWEGVAHETLGFGAPKQLSGDSLNVRQREANTKTAKKSIKDKKVETQIAELNTPAFDELVKRASKGDKDATRQVIDAFDTDPRVAKYAASIEDKDIEKYVKTFENVIGNPNKHGIIKDPDMVVSPELLRSSISDNVNTVDGTLNMARGPALADDLNLHFDKQWETLKAEGLVNDIGTTQREQLRELTQRSIKVKDEKDAYKLRQTIIASGDHLHEMARKAVKTDRSNLDELAYDRAYEFHMMIEATDPTMYKAHAASLNGIMSKGNNARSRLRKINKLVDPIQETNMSKNSKHSREVKKKMLAGHEMGNNSYAVSRFMSKIPRGKTSDIFFELYTNSILSGPMTHAVNLSSNAFLTLWSPTETFLEGTSALARGDYEKAITNYAESIAKVAGIGQGFMDAYRIMIKKTPLEELGYPDAINKRHELAHQMINPAITAEALNQSGTLGRFIDAAGKVARFPGNALMAEDKWMKIMHNRIEINAAAVREARLSSSDFATQRLAYNVRRMNPSDHTIEQAQKMADYYTFTNELGSRQTAVAKGLRAIPSMRYFIPFFNTPLNIANMGLRHSFLGNMRYDFKNALATGAKGDIARAKIAMGTGAAVALLGTLPETDFVSGHVDMSTPKGKFKAQQGIPPYSIRIGDEWYSYERIEPMRSILGLFVNYKEAYNAMDTIDPKTGQPTEVGEQMASALLAPIINTIGDSFMLDAIGGILNMINGVNSGNPDYAYRQFQRTVTSMMPYSSAVKQLTQYSDKVTDGHAVYRRAEGWVEMARQNIPGMSKSIPATQTIWGDDQLYPESLGPDLISPVYTANIKTDKYDQEIIRLDISIPPQPREFFFEGEKIELTPRQTETFGKLRGKGLGENQPSLKEIVVSIMDDPGFIAASDIDKRAVLSDVFHTMTEATQGYMMENDPTLVAQLQTALQNREIEKARTR